MALLSESVQRAVQGERVVLFVSPLTDARPVTGWLQRHGVAFEQVQLSMASALTRDEFHQLQTATGWRGLPQIFIDGTFIGGIEEFFAHPLVTALSGAETPVRVQRTAQWLGYAGALPFIACAALALLTGGDLQATALQALLGYGAVILSFLGALHWTRALQGVAVPGGAPLLTISVLPALLAWLALLLPPREAGVLLAAGFVAVYLFDRRAWRGQPWFLRLRLHLSAVAVSCLLLGAGFAVPSA